MTTQRGEEAYKKCLDRVKTIAQEQLSHCTKPIEVAVAEATQLALAAREDQEALMGAGIDAQMIEDLSLRADALVFAAAKYQIAIETDPEAAEQWKVESEVGYEVRKYLVKFMSFAFRKNEKLVAQMENIKEGRGHKDMVLDLLGLAILGEENAALLAQMPMFNREKVEEARNLNTRLNDLLAKSTLDPKAVNEAKDIFHRMWTDYNLLAKEVKEYGLFLFEGTDRHNRYVSDYYQSNAKSNTLSDAAPLDNASNL